MTTRCLRRSLLAAVSLTACPHDDANVCGDHVLGPGEACDVAGAGCDDACHLTGATAWTVRRSDANASIDILDIAVGASGRIAVLGVTHDVEPRGSPWLLALDPAGKELWRAALAADDIGELFPPHVAVDADDGAYVQGYGVRHFDREGRPDWDLAPEDASIVALVAADDAAFIGSVGAFHAERPSSGVQRVDPATGQSVWSWYHTDGAFHIPISLTIAGELVVAMGYRSASLGDRETAELVFVDAASGELVQIVPADPAETWTGVAGLGVGDVVITGLVGDEWFVRRVGPDGVVRWDSALDFGGRGGLADLAGGPDDSIILVGDDRGPDPASPPLTGVVRAFIGDGEPVWDVMIPPESPWGSVSVRAVAFGPGFLVVAGQESNGIDLPFGWIRRIGPK
jgi:outer membrane protein assembly factor BamB